MYDDDQAPIMRFDDLPLLDKIALGTLFGVLLLLCALSASFGLAWAVLWLTSV